MKSCIYKGWIRHRRYQNKHHGFQYPLFMMFLDLDELPDVFAKRWFWSARRFAPAWFCRKDYLFNPVLPLKSEVEKIIFQSAGKALRGPVRMLTHLRYFGYCFNPLTLYYCYDKQDDHVEFIVAEVSNTPWGEKHCYVLSDNLTSGAPDKLQYRHDKTFHVSPFLEMNLEYCWRLLAPGKKLVTHIQATQNEKPAFDATLVMHRREITGPSLAGILIFYPFMTLKIITLIYYQALILWLKRIPFISHTKHPANSTTADPK